MTQAKLRFASFEDYLEYEDDTDDRYELIDGELIPLAPESGLNQFIARYLLFMLVNGGAVPLRLICSGCEIQVPVLRPRDAANRYPDLVILQPEHWALTRQRLTITLTMPAPQLVAEVVSPGKTNHDRDYVRKRAQYAARGIPEYWLIDPQTQTILVLQLQECEYLEVGTFQGNDRLVSPTLPTLELTIAQVFAAAE